MSLSSIGQFLAGVGEVVHVLEVEPVFGRGAEVFAEAQRGGGGDALTALDDGSDPAVGQAGRRGRHIRFRGRVPWDDRSGDVL